MFREYGLGFRVGGGKPEGFRGSGLLRLNLGVPRLDDFGHWGLWGSLKNSLKRYARVL